MNPIKEEMLLHYGMPRRSGRYPWGSGKNPNQHGGDLISRVTEMRKQGFTFTDEKGKTWTGDTAIAKSLGLTTSQFRTQMSIAKDERRSVDVARAKALREKGYSLQKIAEEMGFNNDSSVRSLLNENSEARMNQAKKTAEFLKQQVAEKGMIDVGTGVERSLGISKEKMRDALYLLELEGYPNYGGGVAQVTNPGKQTNLKVLCPPGTEHKDIYDLNIRQIGEEYVSHDGGDTFDKFVYPKSMDSSRLKINYAEEGGKEKDGLIEIRRGVEDLSLGNSHYAQVRIMVDGTHYLKGMAVYSDNLPPGIDIAFNTNKHQGTPALGPKDNTVLKTIKNDPENPFGSLIKAGGQSYYIDKDGNRQLSLINKRAEEGDWSDWKDKLPSQFLSKQSLSLVNKQLNLAAADKEAEFDEICSLTNPTIKKRLLQSFADDCDSAAVHLQAAALPRQKYHVIIPVPELKDNEIYAPNYRNGETVVAVRYPHGGTFEIPQLKVNNNHAVAKNLLGNAIDAVGINSKVAERLSGADFDGDTVMIIPCNSSRSKVRITTTDPLEGLKDFDPKAEYPERPGMRHMKNTQTEMGKISNLITDMTLKGAPTEDIAKAVRHSMVVIDAEKHNLDYKKSELDNNIASLKKTWQGRTDEDGHYHEGASTLISRAKSETSVLKRKGSPIIDKETGEQSWKVADNLEYVDKKTGKTKIRTQQSTQMAEAKDAHTLSSGHPIEEAYADYANRMKSLANQARKVMVNTEKIQYSASARTIYSEEVKSLMSKLNLSLMNAPKERQAQIMANTALKAKKQENPDMTKAEIKKVGQQELTKARSIVGAKRTPIDITDREWKAIQAGAISENQLSQIINHADLDKLRQRATPRASTTLSSAKINSIKAWSRSGYSIAEIADRLGVSSSTVSKYLN